MKNLGKALIFILILLLLLIGANALFMPQTDFSADTSKGCEELDYIVLGTSNVFYDVNPTVIWDEAGFVGYNLSSEQAPIIINYYQLKNELKKHTPKVVFFDTSGFQYNYGKASFNQLSLDKMPLNFDKLKLIGELKEDDEKDNSITVDRYKKINYLIPLYKFHSRWKELFEGTLYSQYHDKYEHLFMGYVATKDHYVYEKDYKWLPTNEELGAGYVTEITDVNRHYFGLMRELCESKEIRLVLFKTPSKGWTQDIHEAVTEFAKEEGLEFFEMNTPEPLAEMGIDEKTDLADSSSHFNVYGSEKISRYLARYMKRTCNFSDKRKTEAQNPESTIAFWNGLYESFRSYVEAE
ncbi:MAG: hypothetical protein MJ092_08280 [Lachnospiraceae bacterium]|nr:hypothetical protein [Lachnospiraceae bacterium]